MKRELVISGMTCLDCSRHATKALEHVSGVSSAVVDYRDGRATVVLDQAVAPDVLADAVARAGYRVERDSDSPSLAGAPPARTHQRADGGAGGTPTGTADFELLVIGTGGAGMAAAIQAVGMGGKVAIVRGGYPRGHLRQRGVHSAVGLELERSAPSVSSWPPVVDRTRATWASTTHASR